MSIFSEQYLYVYIIKRKDQENKTNDYLRYMQIALFFEIKFSQLIP